MTKRLVRRELLFVVVQRVGGVVIKITEVLDALSATQVFVWVLVLKQKML